MKETLRKMKEELEKSVRWHRDHLKETKEELALHLASQNAPGANPEDWALKYWKRSVAGEEVCLAWEEEKLHAVTTLLAREEAHVQRS